ncbi:MAG: C40 family peptidase [Candidatus Kapabacteria bacterium]|nr:C40 family peptidase [Candidatus Kapabacteria bacterium]
MSAICSVAVALAMAGCASSLRYSQHAGASALTALQRQVLAVAASYVGTPYCKGGVREKCFDCSGYVQTVFAAVGIYLPRTTLQQSHAGHQIPPEQLQAADVVFFRFSGQKPSIHVGIYAGDGTLYHASETRGVIREQLWGTYLEHAIMQCRRVLPKQGDIFR